MTPEDRLRDAAKAYTDPIQPAPDGWARVRERVDAEPRRRRVPAARVALASFATAIVVALLVTLVAVVRDGDGRGTGVTAGPTGDRPSQIAAITENGRVVVLDATTGAEVRTLATSADAGSRIAVTPDGRRVLFDRSAANASPDCSQTREIVGVAISGGEPELVAASASEPAISPDGRLLAYLGHDGPDGCTVPQSLVVQEMDGVASGREWTLPGGGGQYLGRPTWAPDSRHLAFGIFESDAPKALQVLNTETAQTLADAQPLELAENLGWAGYLGTSGEFLGAVLPPGYGITDATFQVVALDETGQVARELFSVTGTVSDPFVADASGRHVLLRTGPDGDSEALYRWSEGDAGLTKISDAVVVAAAWLPDAQAPPEASAEIVAATSDGRLVVMDADTGAELRTLADGLDERPTIAVTPDGERIFFDRPSGPDSDPPAEIATVPTRGGDVDRLIGGAGQPTVSPDGRLLAFVRYEPPGLQVVELPDSFDAWTPNVVGDGRVSESFQAVIGLSWSPGSRHLAYTVVNTPDGNYPRITEIGYDIALDTEPLVPLPLPSCAVVAYLGVTHLMVGVSGDRVIAIDPTSGREVRELFRGPGLGCARDQAPSSDPSGASVAYITQGPAPALYRWSEGDAEPTKVADGIVAAAWLPPRS